MGLYGSPELFPSEKQYSYGTYQPPCKVKRHWGMFFIGFCVGIICVSVVYGLSSQNSDKKGSTVGNYTPYVATSALTGDSSQGYIKSWAETVVSKGLLYPETAQYSGNESDWQIIRNGSTCEILSRVTAKDKNQKVGSTPFRVKIAYDELSAQVTFVQIGSHISYDATTIPSTSGRATK